MRARSLLATGVIVVATGACAASRSTARGSRGAEDTASGSMVVFGSELSRADGSLQDALERLRPWVFGARGTPTFVTVDGSPPADLSLLRSIRASTVQEVRLLRASSSVGRAVVSSTGNVVVGDIIAVTTRSGPDRRR